jgi:hypothetical protein
MARDDVGRVTMSRLGLRAGFTVHPHRAEDEVLDDARPKA